MFLFEVVKHSHGLEITSVDGNQSSEVVSLVND